MTLGFKRAGVLALCSVERNPDAVATYKQHSPEVEHHASDIRDVNLAKYRGAARIVFGGPPCQPFSTGGLQRGARDRRDMVPAFLSAVEVVQPDAVVMENVPGLASTKMQAYLFEFLRNLAGLGYVPVPRILNAAHYGVPQNRKRLFVVALRDRPFRFPRPTHGPGTGKPMVPSKKVLSVKRPRGEAPNCPVVFARYPDLRPSPYHGHVYNGQGRPIDLSAPCHTILASSGGYKTHWVDTQNIAVEYHRYLMNGGTPREGQVPGARRLSVEECALVQTFPKELTFAGSRSSQYTQVGDAVPPLLAEQVARALVEQLLGDEPDDSTHLHSEPLAQRLW
jgi:DNA (cytosine-5)-methyltransferase 1